MKKIILFTVVLLLISSAAWSQSLQDNEYYQKMLELKAMSEQAFEDGDYMEAKRLAEESRSYKEESERWIASQLAAYRAKSALNRLKDRLAQVSAWNAKNHFPDEYSQGVTLYNQSFGEFFDDEEYVKSLDTSNRALEVLSVIRYVVNESTLPAYYMVRLLPGNTDCLWNIAGYDFIYGDPWKWRILYDANKDALIDRDNPDLILPEMKLVIPALKGENRSGTWDNGVVK
ncbi:MAG: hypothetical protein DRZ90_16425 [Spirochaetes bacterium]|nr:MAG: hypothetical protein DRP60_07785 [Spirochaetota bacterium]RKX90326.1 MAG: hypothetical protein DRZ90_16425 [Spirochaetota bacterium]